MPKRYSEFFFDKAQIYFILPLRCSYYVAARMKPNYARRIFPSYDEPRFKTMLKISLNTTSQYKAISNIEGKDSVE